MSPALVLWFTGLSGSGKSTVAIRVKRLLEAAGQRVEVIDGDEMRRQHQPPLGYTRADIEKNNALIARHCAGLRDARDVILVPLISPFSGARAAARRELGEGFYLVYFDADVETVAARDVKGLYTMAARGEIANMIGYSPGSPYEQPGDADFVVHSGAGGEMPEQSAVRLLAFIQERLAARAA